MAGPGQIITYHGANDYAVAMATQREAMHLPTEIRPGMAIPTAWHTIEEPRALRINPEAIARIRIVDEAPLSDPDEPSEPVSNRG